MGCPFFIWANFSIAVCPKIAIGLANNLFHLCLISWLTDAQYLYAEASVQTDGNLTAHLQ